MTEIPEILTTAQTAAVIDERLSPRTLERWRRTGRGPAFVKVGPRLVGYTRAAIAAWLQQQERRHTKQKPRKQERRLDPRARRGPA